MLFEASCELSRSESRLFWFSPGYFEIKVEPPGFNLNTQRYFSTRGPDGES